MQMPLQIAFRDMEPSPAVTTRIQQGVAKLESVDDHITSCRVLVEAPHEQRRHGRGFRVRLDVTVPGRREIVVTRASSEHDARTDVYAVIRDAFRTARQLMTAR